MSEIIGTFELDHICNTFTTDENNMITNHTNWRGTVIPPLVTEFFSRGLRRHH